MRIPKHKCPHCGSAMIIKSSRQDHPLIKTLYAQCLNIECGGTYQGVQEWKKQLSPSGTPDPDIAKQLNPNSPPRFP